MHGETTPDGKFSIEETRCIGACGLAPVFTVNRRGIWESNSPKVRSGFRRIHE